MELSHIIFCHVESQPFIYYVKSGEKVCVCVFEILKAETRESIDRDCKLDPFMLF